MDRKIEETKQRCRARIVELNRSRREIVRLEYPPPRRAIKRAQVSRVVPHQPPPPALPQQQQAEQQQPGQGQQAHRTPAVQQSKVEREVSQVMKTADSNAPCLIYPPGRGGYTVCASELECLKEGRYINDTVVNLMLVWARIQCEVESKKGVVRVEDSPWYTQLSRDAGSSLQPDAEKVKANLSRLRRWFPDGHPFGQPVTVVPVCSKAHWVLMIVAMDGKDTMIFGLDSLQTELTQTASATLRIALSVFCPDQTVRTCSLNVRRQVNMTDCCLHVIHNGLRMLWTKANRSSVDVEEVEQILNQEPCPITRGLTMTVLESLARNEPQVPEGVFPRTPSKTDVEMDLELSDIEGEEATAAIVVPPGRELAITS